MNDRQYRALGGVSLLAGATVILLGFVTAQANYPGYSTTTQTISALGAASAPGASQTAFNATMVLAGLLLLVGAYGFHRLYGRELLSVAFAVTSLGVVGVGVFPADTGAPHFVAAAVAFGGIGVLALAVTTLVDGAFTYASAALGALELVAFVLFVGIGDATVLGIGGLERWVAYLAVVWAAAFGGYVLADGHHRPANGERTDQR